MSLSKTDKITLQIALTLFYALWIYAFINDSMEAREDPVSHGAMIMDNKPLWRYLFENYLIILYLLAGIGLLYVKIKHKFWWVLLHLSPILYIIIDSFVRPLFDPEWNNL